MIYHQMQSKGYLATSAAAGRRLRAIAEKTAGCNQVSPRQIFAIDFANYQAASPRDALLIRAALRGGEDRTAIPGKFFFKYAPMAQWRLIRSPACKSQAESRRRPGTSRKTDRRRRIISMNLDRNEHGPDLLPEPRGGLIPILLIAGLLPLYWWIAHGSTHLPPKHALLGILAYISIPVLSGPLLLAPSTSAFSRPTRLHCFAARSVARI